jgi:hypothetical protein
MSHISNKVHTPPTIRLRIPVSKIVRQFIMQKENLWQAAPKPLSSRTFTATFLTQLLVTEDLFAFAKESKIVEEFDDFLTVDIEVKTPEARFIPDYNILYFNVTMRRLMDEFLLERVIDRYALGIEQQDTINDFIDDFGLDGLCTVDGLRKALQRLENIKGLPLVKKRKLRYGIKR